MPFSTNLTESTNKWVIFLNVWKGDKLTLSMSCNEIIFKLEQPLKSSSFSFVTVIYDND